MSVFFPLLNNSQINEVKLLFKIFPVGKLIKIAQDNRNYNNIHVGELYQLKHSYLPTFENAHGGFFSRVRFTSSCIQNFLLVPAVFGLNMVLEAMQFVLNQHNNSSLHTWILFAVLVFFFFFISLVHVHVVCGFNF